MCIRDRAHRARHQPPSPTHIPTAPTDYFPLSRHRMKLSLSTSELLNQLQTVTRVASTRSAVQALSGVMISVSDDSAPELRATDMEIGLRVPLKAETSRPGSVVLPARLLLDVARSLPGRLVSAFSGTRRPISISVARSSGAESS